MLNESIVIRRAEASDAQDIWGLVHCEGYRFSQDYILNNISRLFVLTHGKRILGVLCGTPNAGTENVTWVAIHPMYPESTLKKAMITSVQGVLFRKPVNCSSLKKTKRTIISQLFDKILTHIKFRGVTNGISGQQKF